MEVEASEAMAKWKLRGPKIRRWLKLRPAEWITRVIAQGQRQRAIRDRRAWLLSRLKSGQCDGAEMAPLDRLTADVAAAWKPDPLPNPGRQQQEWNRQLAAAERLASDADFRRALGIPEVGGEGVN